MYVWDNPRGLTIRVSCVGVGFPEHMYFLAISILLQICMVFYYKWTQKNEINHDAEFTGTNYKIFTTGSIESRHFDKFAGDENFFKMTTFPFLIFVH